MLRLSERGGRLLQRVESPLACSRHESREGEGEVCGEGNAVSGGDLGVVDGSPLGNSVAAVQCEPRQVGTIRPTGYDAHSV